MGKILAVCGVVVGLILLVAIYGISTSNKEIRLHNQILAQQEVNKAVHDTMWKILQDKAGVTNEYKTTFTEVYPKLMAARYQDRKNLLFQFVKESNPNFDVSLYKDLMVSIEGERKNFLREQKKLRDLKMEHDNLIDMFPSSLFVGGRPKIDVVIVTSTASEEAFETGKDDNSLFPKR